MTGAAFFDLDRTLLKGASGPLITEALQAAGVVSSRGIPGQGALYKLFDLVGETLPTMALARGAALVAKGWDVEVVERAGVAAADALEALVSPYAIPLLEDHRAAGRMTVLATTTPRHLVLPLAERLGFDDVVATRYATDGGFYTGALEGEFVWSTGKRSAVVRWAGEHGVDLAESYAYSDSVYDLPLLRAVGHPHAVNADPRLRVAATVAGWPILRLDTPPGVPTLFGIEPMDLISRFSHPAAIPFAKLHFEDLEHIPADGPVILVANHRSYFDPMVLSLAASRRGRALRFLGKREVFDAPVVGTAMRALGQIPVDRGSGSDAPLEAAALALRAGEAVCILPQGTIPRGRALYDPVLQGRPGVVRLAAMTGAPIVPIGLWGTEAVWPRSAKVPSVWNVTSPPPVSAVAGPRVAVGSGTLEAKTKRVMQAITALLPPEASQPYEPTDEEIRRASPS